MTLRTARAERRTVERPNPDHRTNPITLRSPKSEVQPAKGTDVRVPGRLGGGDLGAGNIEGSSGERGNLGTVPNTEDPHVHRADDRETDHRSINRTDRFGGSEVRTFDDLDRVNTDEVRAIEIKKPGTDRGEEPIGSAARESRDR